MLTIARVRDGIVVNLECAAPDWVAAYSGPDTIVPYTPEEPAWIGYGYDPETGFEQPSEA